MSFFSVVVTGALATGALLFAAAPTNDPEPSPDLTPEEVIRIQVEALQANDSPTPDAGIAAAFRFASPGNRAATGPLPRFTQMVKGGYADMLGFASAEYGPIQVAGDQAQQAVTLVQRDGRRTVYMFALGRQRGGRYDGCWMTDGVGERAPATNGLRRT